MFWSIRDLGYNAVHKFMRISLSPVLSNSPVRLNSLELESLLHKFIT